MHPIADWLQHVGTATLPTLWLPLLAWSVFAGLVLLVLHVGLRTSASTQYVVRSALLLALPAGLLVAALTDVRLATGWTSASAAPLQETLTMWLPSELPTEPAAATPAWNLYHLLGGLTILACILALIEGFRLAWQAVVLACFSRRLAGTSSVSLQRLVDQHACALDLRQRVTLRITHHDIVPMTIGWRAPVIYLPASLAGDADALRMTLVHELIHIRRYDFLLQCIERLISAVFALNPLVWVLRRSVAFYREASCDAEVLSQPAINGRRYATLLFHFAMPAHRPHAFALQMSVSKQQLKKRILAMTTHRHHASRSKFFGITVGGLLLIVATVFVACTDLLSPDLRETPAPQEQSATASDVFVVVEEMPELLGGLGAIQQEIQYPALAKKAGIEGRVIVQFVVDEEGHVIEPKVVRGVGSGCDEEALRVVQQAAFKPGRQHGEPVKVKMSIPITFKLGDELANTRPTLESGVTVDEPRTADGVYMMADEMPKLVGGLAAVQSNLLYPTIAKNAGIEGRVIVQFVVDAQGNVVDPEVVRGIGGGCDEEALRAVQQAQFEPGRNAGQPVPVRMSIPVTFRLPSSESLENKSDASSSTAVPRTTYQVSAQRLTSGSVRVLSQGTTLREGADYNIDYARATVTITNPVYLQPGIDIEIFYDLL